MTEAIPTPSLAKLLITSQNPDNNGLPSPANSNLGSPNQKYVSSEHETIIKQEPVLAAALARDLRELTPQPDVFLDISLCGEEEESLSIHSDSEKSEEDSAEKKTGPRRCDFCGATSTPMWRHGPGEYTNLCNSCGVKWRRGKILANGENRHHLCKNSNVQAASKKLTPKKKSSPFSENAEISNTSSGQKRKYLSDYVRSSSRKTRAVSWTPDSADEDSAVSTTNDNDEAKVAEASTQADPLTLSEPAIKALTNDFATLLDKLTPEKTAEFTAILAKCFEPKVAEAYQAGVEVEMSVLDISQEAWSALKQVVC
jgi:GATA zinc finger